MATTFKIKNKKNDGSYRYVRYEDGKKVETGTGTYTKWDGDEDVQSAWSDAVKGYCKEKGIELPSDKIKKSLDELKEKLGGSTVSLGALSSLVPDISSVMNSLMEDPVGFVNSIITICKMGPVYPHDLLMAGLKTAKDVVIAEAKNQVSNYENIVGAYVTPVEQTIETVNDEYISDFDAAQEEWRKKYAEEVYSFEIVLSEYEPPVYQQAGNNPGGSDDESDSGSYYYSDSNENNSTVMEGDYWSNFGSLSFSDDSIPDEIQKAANDAFRARYGGNELPKNIYDRYMDCKAKYFDSGFSSCGVPIQMSVLSIIESNCNSGGRASEENAFTALGMWQFVRSAGFQYNLLKGHWKDGSERKNNKDFIITSDYDYRRDAEKQSEAAAKYLRDAHKICKTWFLTAAGYNWGSGNVQKKILKEYGTSPWTALAHMPSETRTYCLLLIRLNQVLGLGTGFINS